MPTVQIDPDILIKAMTAAIQAAIQPTAEPEPAAKPKAKRGRPAKAKKNEKQSELANTEIITIDEEISIDSDSVARTPSNKHIFNAKELNRTNAIGVACGAEDVTKRRGPIKFLDIQNVGDRIPASKYPEPTERRNPVQKMKFECDRCGKNFEAYPSECPQAFMKEKISGVAEGKPRVLCENCIGR